MNGGRYPLIVYFLSEGSCNIDIFEVVRKTISFLVPRPSAMV